MELQIIATGMHLSPEFGLTYRDIERDGFSISARVEMLLSSDTSVGTVKSIGMAMIGFADAMALLRPDVVVLLGDRFEMLAAAQTALVLRIPVAHIAGGDVTEGAFDDAIRHSITKMSHLHFVTNAKAGDRVRQLGENHQHIFNYGSPGIDWIRRLKLLDRRELENALDIRFRKRNLLVTFHPVTLDETNSLTQMNELLGGLDELGDDVGLIFTKPNADPEGRSIGEAIEQYVATRPHARSYPSLGSIRYLSAMAQVDAVVGNSSSGLYEAPSLKIPTVNIGDRQKGRLLASSVIQCEPHVQAIAGAIRQAFDKDCSQTINPHGIGDASVKIVSALKSFPDFKSLLKKPFCDR